jgi:hypothetical protein
MKNWGQSAFKVDSGPGFWTSIFVVSSESIAHKWAPVKSGCPLLHARQGGPERQDGDAKQRCQGQLSTKDGARGNLYFFH